jgi:hypothetical protein
MIGLELCELGSTGGIAQRSADLEYQLTLQVARFAEPMHFACVYRIVSDDRGRPDRTGVEKREHPLEMSAIGYHVRAQGFDIGAGRQLTRMFAAQMEALMRYRIGDEQKARCNM